MTPEQAEAAIKDAIERDRAGRERAVREQREMYIQWAAVLCTCRRWYSPDAAGPPQADCIVHSTLLISPDGGEVL